jgi:hypothetical protein
VREKITLFCWLRGVRERSLGGEELRSLSKLKKKYVASAKTKDILI